MRHLTKYLKVGALSAAPSEEPFSEVLSLHCTPTKGFQLRAPWTQHVNDGIVVLACKRRQSQERMYFLCHAQQSRDTDLRAPIAPSRCAGLPRPNSHLRNFFRITYWRLLRAVFGGSGFPGTLIRLRWQWAKGRESPDTLSQPPTPASIPSLPVSAAIGQQRAPTSGGSSAWCLQNPAEIWEASHSVCQVHHGPFCSNLKRCSKWFW